MTAKMEILGNKQTNEEMRGEMVTLKIDALEETQKTVSESLMGLVNGINSVSDAAKKEPSKLKEGLNEVKNNAKKEAGDARKEAFEARKEASDLKDMMRQLTNNSINSTRQTPVTATEKRKHDTKTPSTNPEEKEMPSPDHRKQRQHNVRDIVDPPRTTLPLAIDFEESTEDINMDMDGSDAAPSVNSMFSEGTMIEVEEELSIIGHNFNNNNNKMDYTTSPIGEVPLKPWGDIEVYNWDGQMHCPRTDCFKLDATFKHEVCIEVPCFCSNLSTVSSSNNH
jgi:hypothetical protein